MAATRWRAAIDGTMDRTEQITREVLARIPRGEYRFVEFFEDDYISDLPVRIALRLISHGDGRVTLDYTGSDPQVRAALNLPAGGMKHHPFLSLGLTNFVVTKSESIHINAGIQRCIDLVLPEASVVNAKFPAACGMRFTTAMRVHDLVRGRADPGAAGRSAGGRRQHAGDVVYFDLGTWATPGGWWWRIRCRAARRVGRIATGFPAPISRSRSCATCRWKCWSPRRRCWCTAIGLVPDSEGPGQFRGGFGVAYELEIQHPSAVVVMRGKDRFRFGSWGVFGGGGGARQRQCRASAAMWCTISASARSTGRSWAR